MIEVEVKVKIGNRNTIEHRLKELAFKQGKLLCETDIYFDKENMLVAHKCVSRKRTMQVRWNTINKR